MTLPLFLGGFTDFSSSPAETSRSADSLGISISFSSEAGFSRSSNNGCASIPRKAAYKRKKPRACAREGSNSGRSFSNSCKYCSLIWVALAASCSDNSFRVRVSFKI
jgi:hypothetical protein